MESSSNAPVNAAADTIAETPSAVEDGNTAKPTGIIVHHLNDSRSIRLLWLLEELQVPYEIQKYVRNADQRAPPTLKAVHPLGKSPIITDGDVTLAESGAITEYLIEKYGKQFRATESRRLDDLYFTHYAEGSLMPVLVYKIIFSIVPKQSPALMRPLVRTIFGAIERKFLNPELKTHCEFVESHLENCPTGWFAGGEGPTSADFMMEFALELLLNDSNSMAGPKTKEYVKRVKERAAYKRAIEKGKL